MARSGSAPSCCTSLSWRSGPAPDIRDPHAETAAQCFPNNVCEPRSNLRPGPSYAALSADLRSRIPKRDWTRTRVRTTVGAPPNRVADSARRLPHPGTTRGRDGRGCGGACRLAQRQNREPCLHRSGPARDHRPARTRCGGEAGEQATPELSAPLVGTVLSYHRM